eukprot:scaffold3627_cov350-Prasinococcus_capsulatus_cf.AAC.2
MVAEETPSSQQTDNSSAATEACDIVPRNLALELSQIEPCDAHCLLADEAQCAVRAAEEEPCEDLETEKTGKTVTGADDEGIDEEEEGCTEPGTVIRSKPGQVMPTDAREQGANESALEVFLRLKPAHDELQAPCIRKSNETIVELVAPEVPHLGLRPWPWSAFVLHPVWLLGSDRADAGAGLQCFQGG